MNINTQLVLEQRSVYELFSPHNQLYIIPTYQRPYSWTEEECQTLLDDLIEFAFPSNKPFNRDNDCYFLGNIVVYRDEKGRDVVIDGQQRIISLLLFLRALLKALEDNRELSKCLWYTDEGGEPDSTRLKIEWHKFGGAVDTPLKNILNMGLVAKNDKSNYANNYRFFTNTINVWTPERRAQFACRLLEHVFFVKFISNNSDRALDMFLKINDRGQSLKVSDIFRAKLCEEAYDKGGMKACDACANHFDGLAKRCDELFPSYGKKDEQYTPIGFAFMLYAYQFGKRYHWSTLKTFYTQNASSRLKDPKTLADIESMIGFFEQITCEADSPFDKLTLKNIALCFSFNLPSCWYLLGLFFLKEKGAPDFNTQLDAFVDRLLAFYVGAAASSEMYMVSPPYKTIYSLPCLYGEEIPEKWFSERKIQHNFSDPLNNMKRSVAVRKIILQWWYFHTCDAVPAKSLQVEHIFSKKLVDVRALSNPQLVESFGNLALLEKKINQKAANHRFVDKKKLYLEFDGSGTVNAELRNLAQTKSDFAEPEILQRDESMLNALLDLLKQQDFLRA